MSQRITKTEREKYKAMDALGQSSQSFRKARTRSLIQLGALIEKTELLETFHIELGRDLQKDIHMKEPVAALFKGLLVLNEMAKSENVYPLWVNQGLEAFRNMGQKK